MKIYVKNFALDFIHTVKINVPYQGDVAAIHTIKTAGFSSSIYVLHKYRFVY